MMAAVLRRVIGVATAHRQRALTKTTMTATTCYSTSSRGSGFVTRSQDEMEALGARVAQGRRAGDVIFLRGDLGCGKTCFARGFIRAMAGDSYLHVTSPTYLLVNTYDEATTEQAESPVIHHVDLYRLESVSDTDANALGLTDAFTTGIALVEWPQHLHESGVPNARLEVHIAYDEDDSSIRHVRFERFGKRWENARMV